jgi:hypothetical protein
VLPALTTKATIQALGMLPRADALRKLGRYVQAAVIPAFYAGEQPPKAAIDTAHGPDRASAVAALIAVGEP